MIFSVILLALAQSTAENQTQLIVTYSDIEYLAQTEIVEKPKADEIWQVLISQAEKMDPSRISVTGFNSMTEHYIFGVVPTISTITSLGALSIVLVLLFLFNAVENFNKNYLIIIFTSLGCFVAVSISITLYEACGVVFVTWLLMMLGFWFMFFCLQTILISFKLLETEYEFASFDRYLSIIAFIFLCVGYYCSLQIGFPLFQLPFFLGFWYLVGYAQKIVQMRFKDYSSIITPLSFLLVSVLTIVYIGIFEEDSFLFLKNSAFVDFRFLAFLSSSIAYSISLPLFLYKLYCKIHDVNEETISVLFKKYMSIQIPQTWSDFHYFILYNFLGLTGLLLLGFFIRSSPLIIAGYLGSFLSILSLPVSRYSNIIYHVMYLSVFFVTAILGYLSDPSFNQFLVFYPKSYILSIGYLLVRIVLILIGLISCSKYRATHFTAHSSIDFFMDFVFGYVQTVMLIVFSEHEPNFMMSWAYFIFLLAQLEPVVKLEPESHSDNAVKAFSILFFGLRLTTIGYSSWIIFISALFIMLVGLFYLSEGATKSKSLKVAFYAYFYLCIQYSCCFNSWILLIFFCVVSNLHIDYQDFKKSTVARSILMGLLILVFSFFVPIKSICSITCHSANMCSLALNPDGNLIEKVILESFLDYLNGSLGY